MALELQKVTCLYGEAENLKFLKPIRNRMKKVLGDNFKETAVSAVLEGAYFSLEASRGHFVVLFVHGTSDYLIGGQHVNPETLVTDSGPKFISRSDLGRFAGKVVFCLSCNSNGLAKDSIGSGAIAFVGFDDIPFFRANSNPGDDHVLTMHIKNAILAAVQWTLEGFISGRFTLDESVDNFRLWIIQDVIKYVRKNVSIVERREVGAILLRIADGAKYHGPLGIRFSAD